MAAALSHTSLKYAEFWSHHDPAKMLNIDQHVTYRNMKIRAASYTCTRVCPYVHTDRQTSTSICLYVVCMVFGSSSAIPRIPTAAAARDRILPRAGVTSDSARLTATFSPPPPPPLLTAADKGNILNSDPRTQARKKRLARHPCDAFDFVLDQISSHGDPRLTPTKAIQELGLQPCQLVGAKSDHLP